MLSLSGHLLRPGGVSAARRATKPGYITALLIWLLATSQLAQALDIHDGYSPDADGLVSTLVVQADGKTIIIGDFATVNGISRNYIARLNADGNLDSTFDPGTGTDHKIYTSFAQADGKILIGGNFTSVNGVTRLGIARLNPDGGLDASFDASTSINGTFLSLQSLPDGKVLAGGFIVPAFYPAPTYIARLNADGSRDTTFDPGTGADAVVRAVLGLPGGKVLIGGDFTKVDGVTRNHIARLNADGSVDLTFNPGAGANASVNTLALQPDGKLLIGGLFTDVNGVSTHNHIARLNTDGSLDADFDLGTGMDGGVSAITVQTDGKVLIGGSFTQVNGVTRRSIARFNADGSLDTSFDDPGSGVDNVVSPLQLQPDGKVLIGGYFTHVDGVMRNHIARLYADSSLDVDLDTSPTHAVNNLVFSVASQPDGKTLIGGAFSSVDSVMRNRIARLNIDGSLDTGFDPGSGADGLIYSVIRLPDGKVLIGGSFTHIDGIARNRIARLNANGSLDTGFDPGSGPNNTVLAMVLQTDGNILIGGQFTQISGATHNHVARLKPDGSLDASFGPADADLKVSSLALQSDGKILIGGNFTHVNGVTRNRIARLNADGGLDTGFDPGAGANGQVFALSLLPDGAILVGGAFTKLDGVTLNFIARLFNDGSLDTDFDPGTGANSTVYALSPQIDGKVIIVGAFTNIDGTSRSHLARLNSDGSLDTGFDPGTGATGSVYAALCLPDGKALIGGNFTNINGVARTNVARISVPEAATQSATASADGDALDWLRGGSGPILSWTTLETSSDGVVWSSPLNGVRITGGWQFTGLGLPFNTGQYVRLRGYFGSSGSGSTTELIQQVYLPQALPEPGNECSFFVIRAANGNVITICL